MDWVVPLLTLSAMEIILGIDNVIFIAILVGKLPPEQRANARRIGLGMALGMRLILLFMIKAILGLQEPVFELTDLGIPSTWLGEHANEVSWRDIILLVGGLFLIGKSTYEIHDKLEGPHAEHKPTVRSASQFGSILVQIAILDIVFSLDSVITAVGMARDLWVMVVAMVIAVGFMLFFAATISEFVHRHPTLKVLALSFLILIGVMLVAEGAGQHFPKGYIYFAMAFSVIVEMINIRVRSVSHPVQLHEPPPVGRTDK